MPRRSKKKALGKDRYLVEDGDHSDSVSVASSLDDRSVYNGSICGDQDVDESTASDQFEEKFDLALDGLANKSASVRVNSLLSLRSALSGRYIPELIANRYVTVCEALCRLLRKGRGSSSSVELVGVAALCRLLCNQLSSSDQLLWLYEEVRDLLHVQADNSCVDPTGRSACCLALAHLALLCQPQPEHVSQQLVQLLKLVGMRGVAPALQATALHAWSVLIGALTPRTLKITVSRELKQICSLLDSDDVTVRTMAGQSLALMYELVWQHYTGFYGDNYDEMCDKLHQLATDSDKSRNKKDRKHQRSVFRDVLKFFEEDEFSNERIKFGSETLVITSWTMRVHYDLFSSLLGSGTNYHLRHNVLLRAVFELGAPLPVPEAGPRERAPDGSGKLQRMYQLHEASKFRQIGRARCRDKRIAVLD